MGDVTGFVTVITGAARGIGRAATERFVEAGSHVVALDRSWEGEEPFAAVLTASGRATVASVDISDDAAVAAIALGVLADHGRVDVLINNAARRQRDLFPPEGITTVLETTAADWRSMFDVNVLGTLAMVHAFVPAMVARGRGSVINVGTRGSVLLQAEPGIWRGGHPTFRNQPYDATKAAMCSLTCYLAEEVREAGVAVNVVFPGPTYTTGSDAIVAARREQGIDARPFLRPDHLAPLLLHLATETAAGDSGLVIDSLEWNRTHGHGDTDQWEYPG
jgi:NAD(P)-dependent dehydrogenase (short-subunit alcohol dehydrogenase family)